METKKILRRGLLVAGATVGALTLASCAEETDPEVQRSADILSQLQNVSYVIPGESVMVQNTESELLLDNLDEVLPIVDHQYPHGAHDNMSPTITDLPMRVDAHVALSGPRSNYLDNDAGCDSFRIQNYQSVSRIGALSLGSYEDRPILVWPEQDGQRSEYAYLCFFENNEPGKGVVLFTEESEA